MKLKHEIEHYRNILKNSKACLFLKYTGAARFHIDGDGIRMVPHSWHPVMWLILVFVGVPACLFTDATVKDMYDELILGGNNKSREFWKDREKIWL